MNHPYRSAVVVKPIPFEIERPWFPRVGEAVRIVSRIEKVFVKDVGFFASDKDVGRIGFVTDIYPNAVYGIEFTAACPDRACGRRLCHATSGLFVLEELGILLKAT